MTSPGVTLDKHAINVKSSAPRHPCCTTVIISSVRQDDKMLIFRRCGGQMPLHNICIMTVPESVSCHVEPVRQDFLMTLSAVNGKEQFSLRRFYPFLQMLLGFGLCLLGLCSIKSKLWICKNVLVCFCLSWGRTRTPESFTCGKDGLEWGKTLPLSQSGELPTSCCDPVTVVGVLNSTKRVIVLLLQVDSVDRRRERW